MKAELQHWRRKLVIDYSEPYKDEIHNLLVKYGLNWTHSPAGIEFYKTGVDDTCNITGYFTKKEYDKLVNWIRRNNTSEEICMMLNSPLGGRRGIGFGLGRSWQRKSADWWNLDETIDNPLFAYQAVNADSYAASKINLANPGAYDAIDGNAPGWDATGWDFNGSLHYLSNGVNAYDARVMIIRYSDADLTQDNQALAGRKVAARNYYIYHKIGSNSEFGLGDGVGTADIQSSGVIAFSWTGNFVDKVLIYRDGVQVGSFAISGQASTAYSIFIGAINIANNPAHFYKGKMQAIAMWFGLNLTTPITSENIADLTTAMNAL